MSFRTASESMPFYQDGLDDDEKGWYYWDPAELWEVIKDTFSGPFESLDVAQKKLLEHNRIVATLNCAQAMAEYIHLDQIDKQGRPIIEHIRRVYRACRSLSLEQRVAAILHDSIEDCEEKIDTLSIAMLFGPVVKDLVWTLTKKKRNSSDYKRYIEAVMDKPSAIPIKLADLYDNLDERRGPIPDSLRKRYVEAKERLESAYRKERAS